MRKLLAVLLSMVLTLSLFTGIAVSEEAGFEIHFIDVGQADAALIICDGKAMLIDGGNVEASSLVYSYLNQHSVTHLDYIICTHAHEDHVGGLAGALNYATVDVALCPVTDYDSKVFSNFVKYLDEQSVDITVPSVGDAYGLGNSEFTILGPVSASDEANNTSIVLRIVYGDTSFLFTGDAEREEEQDILAEGLELQSTVLKVGHHGSETSTTYPFLREVMPQYAVISVGENNSYGHPDDDTLSRLRDADVTVYRTDMQGTIICTSDGNSVSFTTERNSVTDTLASVGANSTQAESIYSPTNFIELKHGDKSVEVVKLQTRLIALGFLSGPADGDYGKNTESAVSGFQIANTLDATGVASPEDQVVLYSAGVISANGSIGNTSFENARACPKRRGI